MFEEIKAWRGWTDQLFLNIADIFCPKPHWNESKSPSFLLTAILLVYNSDQSIFRCYVLVWGGRLEDRSLFFRESASKLRVYFGGAQ